MKKQNRKSKRNIKALKRTNPDKDENSDDYGEKSVDNRDSFGGKSYKKNRKNKE